jgi:hypothetical protein
MDSATICFTCGQPVTTPPRLNDLPDGGPCPTCRERALDTVAPALPSRGRPAPREAADAAREDDELLPAWGPFDDRPEPA